MKTASAILTIIFLTMVGTTTWAEDQIVTIYFAGTSATADMWEASASCFGNPELLATLYHNHLITYRADGTDLGPHHKKFVNGIGTNCGACEPNWTKVDPTSERCKGWSTCVQEAISFLNDVLNNYSGDVILNLVGWSRGGILDMIFAYGIPIEFGDTANRIKRINILAIDPAGHRGLAMETLVSPVAFCLNEKVKQYVGIYARDERSFMFGPAIPDASAATDVWKFIVPGGHKNVVGSDKTWCGSDECADDKIANVSWVTKAIAWKLLTSSQWGKVEFNLQELLKNDPDFPLLNKDDFIDKVNGMWDPSDYWGYINIRQHSILGVAFEAWGLKLLWPLPPIWGGEEACRPWDILEWNIFDLWKNPRCASFFTCSGEHRNIPLEFYVQPQTGEYAWARLEQLGNSPPVALCKDATVSADSTCKGSALINNGSYDPDGDQITLTQIPEGPYSKGNTSVTLTVADTKGTTSQCSATVIVVDTQSPNLACPTSQVVDATGPGGVVVNFSPTTSDNCPGAISVSCMPDSGTVFAIGSTSVTCSAKDASENSTSCSFNVTIRGVADQINSLTTLVNGFNLPSAIGNSLVSKLSNAQTQFSVRNTKAACNVIDAFINEVSAQTGKKITADQANQMIANALRINAVMGR